jgi:transposase
VIGVDDFAWRRSHSYGGIFVDLERSTVIAMPPDRQRDTIMAWLKENPQVRIICRDRRRGYGAATAARTCRLKSSESALDMPAGLLIRRTS